MSISTPSADKSEDTARYSISIPLGMGLVAILVGFSVQSTLAFQEYNSLHSQLQAQEAIYTNASKVRAQLSAIAKGTALLAQQGNSNAIRILGDLKAAGVNVNVDAKP